MATLLRRSNGVYYYVSYYHGRRIWRSTEARRISDALKFLDQPAKKVKLGQSFHSPNLRSSSLERF